MGNPVQWRIILRLMVHLNLLAEHFRSGNNAHLGLGGGPERVGWTYPSCVRWNAVGHKWMRKKRPRSGLRGE